MFRLRRRRNTPPDADITLRLWQLFKPRLHASKVTRVYEGLERPLIPVLAQMERTGIKVDRDTLSRMSNAFAQKWQHWNPKSMKWQVKRSMLEAQSSWVKSCSTSLDMRAVKKEKWCLFHGCRYPEDLATIHDLTNRVSDWRQITKLKSTNTEALQEHINPDTGRVHTSYSIAGANTGRLASTDPNLQNIPVRTEDGRRIREAFIADSGNVLVSLDYSQIELRILAHVAGIDSLKQAFRDGLDIHAMTASEMFDVPLDEMTSDIRRQAKAINFGVIYGISGFGLAATCVSHVQKHKGSLIGILNASLGSKNTWIKPLPLRKSIIGLKPIRTCHSYP